MSQNPLFTPVKAGPFNLKHRLVLAPLTRIRSDEDLCPTDLHVQYYKERATEGGLLITEATVMCPQSIASRHVPAIFNDKQALAWKRVFDAVHAIGGIISLQGWHQGRVAHSSYTEHPLAIEAGAITCEAPSPVCFEANSVGFGKVMVPNETPREMTIDDIERLKLQYIESARLAFEVAGADIYELHGAHGYLFDSFFNNGVNKRTDKYGGSLENRFRFFEEVFNLLNDKYPGRIAVRISPHDNKYTYMGTTDSDPKELYSYIFSRLSTFNLAYILVTEPRWNKQWVELPENDTMLQLPLQSAALLPHFRNNNPGKNTFVIGAGGFSPTSAFETMDLKSKPYDGIAFGRFFISNPDLHFRLANNLPLNRYNRDSFYTAPPFDQSSFNKGYTDYPTFEQVIKSKYGDDSKVEDFIISDQEGADKKAKLLALIELTKDDPYPLVSIEVIGKSSSTDQR
jgi:N-ethylmaleimide reductase